MEQCLNVSMLRFFGFVCLFLTIVGFYFFLCVLLYQLMRSPPGLWDPVERSSRISSPGCRHYKLNPNREFISEKMLSGIFLNYYLKKETKNCHAASLASLNHPPSDEPSCCIMLLWQTLQSLSVASCDVVLNQ